MLWLPTAQLGTIMGSLLLTGVYAFLYFQERTKYMLIWTISWGVSLIRYLASLTGFYYRDILLLEVTAQLAVLVSGVLLLWGTSLFIKERWQKGWAWAAAVCALWMIYGVYAGLSLPVYATPVFLFSAVVYVYTGISFLKIKDPPNLSARTFAGAGFILWGVHKADYPFLRPLVHFAPWGYLIGAFLELFVAFGVLLTYFQKTRYDLLASEQHLSRMNAELEQRVLERTERLEESVRELEAFAYSVSHDLRAPLRAISGFGELLAEEFGAELLPDAVIYLDRILSNSSRMDQLIRDLLMLSQLSKQEISFRQVNLTRLAKGVFDELCQMETACERGIHFEALETPPVLADQQLMRVVLSNLISNAIKFTRDTSQAQITFGSMQEEDQVVFFVRDNGVGFSMEFAEQIFRPFQRLHSGDEYEGTGIGLATVWRGIERHNGRVWAESQEGEGTTICFTLEHVVG